MAQVPGKPRVFVVDDEQVIATTLAMILRTKGFDALSFNCPGEALKAAASERPDLLISDVIMPTISGIELGIQIRHRFPDCKVLLISGQAAVVDMLESARAHGHHFEILLKPIHPIDLLKAIAKTLAI